MLRVPRPRLPGFVRMVLRGMLILAMAAALGLLPLGGEAAIAGGDAVPEYVGCGLDAY